MLFTEKWSLAESTEGESDINLTFLLWLPLTPPCYKWLYQSTKYQQTPIVLRLKAPTIIGNLDDNIIMLLRNRQRYKLVDTVLERRYILKRPLPRRLQPSAFYQKVLLIKVLQMKPIFIFLKDLPNWILKATFREKKIIFGQDAAA